MYEYEIQIKITKERFIIFGYSFEDACKRANLNMDDYYCLLEVYID